MRDLSRSGDLIAFSQLVAEHTNDAIIVTDALGRIEWVNPAFERLSGYKLFEIIGRKPGDFLQGQKTDPATVKAISAALADRKSIRVDIHNYSRSGDEYLLELQINPVFDDNGELTNFISVERDITKTRELMDDSLDLSAYREALDHQAIVSVADRRGRISFVNEKFCKISGYEREELLGKSHSMVNSGHHEKSFFDTMWQTIASGEVWHGEICNQSKDGSIYWVDTTIVPVSDESGRLVRYVSIRYDITKSKKAEKHLTELALTDSLTGLANRMLFQSRLNAMTAAESESAAVMIIDLDHFKDINDTLGHPVGDDLLATLARRFQEAVHDNDTVARLGGDEFALIVRNMGSNGACQEFIERLYQSISEPVEIGQHQIDPSFSIGIALFPKDATDGSTLLKNADIAMYEAKKNGRGQWAFFDKEAAADVQARQTILSMVRQGIAKDQFSVALQPQSCVRTGRHRGFEALARWSVNGDDVPPSVFIPIIEESKFMFDFSEVIWAKAMKAHADLRGLAEGGSIIALNASPRELREPQFTSRLCSMADEFGIPLSEIEVELTETALIGRSTQVVRETIRELRDAGVQIALDDFGTGFSSLEHLREFAVDLIKVDRIFVNDINKNKSETRLVSAVLAFARGLGLETVAEGVSTRDQVDFLRYNGCTYAQGYYIAKPLSPADAESYLVGLASSSIDQKSA